MKKYDGATIYGFSKANKDDKIWWANTDSYGPLLFSFDKEKIYNAFTDYPHKLTDEEKEIFDKENKYLVEGILKNRQ